MINKIVASLEEAVADIADDGQRLAAGLLDLPGRGVDRARQLRVRCRRFCGDDDIGAVACAAQRDGAADAALAAGACDQRNFALKVIHKISAKAAVAGSVWWSQ